MLNEQPSVLHFDVRKHFSVRLTSNIFSNFVARKIALRPHLIKSWRKCEMGAYGSVYASSFMTRQDIFPQHIIGTICSQDEIIITSLIAFVFPASRPRFDPYGRLNNESWKWHRLVLPYYRPRHVNSSRYSAFTKQGEYYVMMRTQPRVRKRFWHCHSVYNTQP